MDLSSDVCSSDLIERLFRHIGQREGRDGIRLSGHDWRREVGDFLDEQVDLAVDGEIIRSRLLALRDAADLIVDGGGIGDRGARGRAGGKGRRGGDARKRRQIGRASWREGGCKYV